MDLENEVVTLWAVDYTEDPIKVVFTSAIDRGEYYQLSETDLEAFDMQSRVYKDKKWHSTPHYAFSAEQALIDYIERTSKTIVMYERHAIINVHRRNFATSLLEEELKEEGLKKANEELKISLEEILDYAFLLTGLGESYEDWEKKTNKAKELIGKK